jgi:hypothetical protein
MNREKILNIRYNNIKEYIKEIINKFNNDKFIIDIINFNNIINIKNIKIQFNNFFIFKNGSFNIKKNIIKLNFKNIYIPKNSIIIISNSITITNNFINHLIILKIILFNKHESKLINNNYICNLTYINHNFRYIQIINRKKKYLINIIRENIIIDKKKLNLGLYMCYIQEKICNIIYYKNNLLINNNEQKGGENTDDTKKNYIKNIEYIQKKNNYNLQSLINNIEKYFDTRKTIAQMLDCSHFCLHDKDFLENKISFEKCFLKKYNHD